MKARLEHNIKRVRKSVDDTHGAMTLRTRAMARKMAGTMRDNIRANIAPRPMGVFPGYAITGALAKKVVAQEPQKTAAGWWAKVYIRLTGKTRLYAFIHEIGGIIRAKNAPYLVFRIPGVGWFRKKQVRIRRKWYFARGVNKTRREWGVNRLARELKGV